MEDKSLQKLFDKGIIVNMDESYHVNLAIKNIRKLFMSELLKDKQFFTQEEFKENEGKILSFTGSLRTITNNKTD